MMCLVDTEARQLRNSAGMIEAEPESLRYIQRHSTRITRRRLSPIEKIELQRLIAIPRMNCYPFHC
jgi:hypothetical protein